MKIRKRTVVFKAFAFGLALMSLWTVPVSLAGPSHSVPPGFMTVLIQGQATFCENGQPLQGAKVIIFSQKNHDLKVETITNSHGQFSVLAILFGSDVQATLLDLAVEFPGYDIGQLLSLAIGNSLSISACVRCSSLEDEFTWDEPERKENETDEDYAKRLQDDLTSRLNSSVDQKIENRELAQGIKEDLAEQAEAWAKEIATGKGAVAKTFNVYFGVEGECVNLLSIRVYRGQHRDFKNFPEIVRQHELGHTEVAKCIAQNSKDVDTASARENDPRGPQGIFHQEFGSNALETIDKMRAADLDDSKEEDIEKFMRQAVEKACKSLQK